MRYTHSIRRLSTLLELIYVFVSVKLMREGVNFEMKKETTAIFIGHRECYEVSYDDIMNETIRLIECGVTDFLNGGMGSFDWLCARIVSDLRSSYPYIRNYLVIPYLAYNIAEKKYFNSIIYPESLEKYSFKAAIPARNRYLVDNAAYAICYVKHSWGGAAQTLRWAVKKGLNVINLAETY